MRRGVELVARGLAPLIAYIAGGSGSLGVMRVAADRGPGVGQVRLTYAYQANGRPGRLWFEHAGKSGAPHARARQIEAIERAAELGCQVGLGPASRAALRS
jgi:hypothetical protein